MTGRGNHAMIEKTTKTCPICGKEFEIVGNARNRKYCSTQCLRRAGLTSDRRKSIIKRTANYNDRVNLARYYVLKCRVCGWSLQSGVSDENGKINKMGGCEMHHITPVSEGGTDGRENLILLCPISVIQQLSIANSSKQRNYYINIWVAMSQSSLKGNHIQNMT